MLLKSGADTNLKMTDGRTPLHIAAESGSIAVLKLLLAHDANALNPDMVSTYYFKKLYPREQKLFQQAF